MNSKLKAKALKELPLVHPGEILSEEFLKPLGISEYRLAKSISVPPRRINEIVHGDRSITADTALRLSMFFGTSPQFWLNLQASYELRRLERESRLPEIVPFEAIAEAPKAIGVAQLSKRPGRERQKQNV